MRHRMGRAIEQRGGNSLSDRSIITSMARELRNKDPRTFRFVTIRTLESRLWMVPSRNMSKLIGGIVARYASLMRIELYAYCFLSNHYHLLIRAPEENVDEFSENINREIARRVNWKTGRKGTFWPVPYSDQPVLSSDDLVEAFVYITTNAVKHGLVDHPSKWPGLNSFHQSMTGDVRKFSFTRYSERDPALRTTIHELRLSILPQFEDMAPADRAARIRELIDRRAAFLREYRTRRGRGFLGVEAVLSQVPGCLPKETTHGRAPCAYSKNPALLRKARIEQRERRSRYTEASRRYRSGEWNVEFPSYSFRPPLHRKPRSAPFQVIGEESRATIVQSPCRESPLVG